ncbi:hypothetical protein D9M71_395680 [compost metagenome]
MGIALEDRQAIEVRPNAAHQHVVAVVQQVMRGDGGGNVARGCVDERHGIGCGDVLEHHFQAWEALDDTAHVFVDEHLLAVKYIDLATGHFTVHQQWHADFGHGFECREDLVDAGHARIGVGRRAGRVQLGCMHETTGLCRADFLRLGAVGEVQHHQRLEAATGRAGSQDALTVGVGFFCVAYRWYKVGHDDCAAKSARNVSDSVGQHGTITKMDVPVIGTQEGQAVGHWGFQAGRTHRECYRKRHCGALAIKFCPGLPIRRGMP